MVDLRLSSLVELARFLDLELTLVPRRKLPAVKAIIRGDNGQHDVESTRRAGYMLRRLVDQIEQLPSELRSEFAIQELQRRARELIQLELSADELVHLQDASAAVKAFFNDPRNAEAVEGANDRLRKLRNTLAHGVGRSVPSLPRPAYRLDGDDHA